MGAMTLIVLLLFGVQLLNGQTVSKFEFKNGTEVYEIIELQNNTVEFVNPVKAQPTLREIIFYKMIEKPYIVEKNDEQDVVTKEKANMKKPDFDETVRPFTNGHGLQFVEWGSQDENMQHTHAPDKDKVANNTSTNSNENHNDNDDANDNKDIDNNDKDKLDDDYDDGDNKNNDKISNVDDKDNDNDKDNNNDDDEDDKAGAKEHSSDDSKNIDDEGNNRGKGDIIGDSGEKVPDEIKDTGVKKIVDDNVKEEITKEEDEKTREDRIHEEQLDLAKKLRSELFNATKEKYHTLVRNHENATHERRKRDVSYQNIPDAPTLPDLDTQAFPAYVQRMLANRPTFSQLSQDNAKTMSNYNSDLFHKMSGMFSNNNPKTYGFKYNNDRSESWNDIHKAQGNENDPTVRDLSGSETNNPYEKIPETNIDFRNSFVSDEDRSLSKNKDEMYENPKNNYSSEINKIDVDDSVDSKQKNLEKLNNPDKLSDINIKDKLITMFQNIDNKFSNGNGNPPKTYGMSIKGDKVETWNDIDGTPTASNNRDNILKGSENEGNKMAANFNAQNNINRLNVDTNEETTAKFDNKRYENIAGNKPQVDENFNVAPDKTHLLNGNIEEDLGNYDEEPVSNVDSADSENIEEYKPNSANLNAAEDSRSPEEEDERNYGQELDEIPASTNKIINNILKRPTEQPYHEKNYYDEIKDPQTPYESPKNSNHVQSSNDRPTKYDQINKIPQFTTEIPVVYHISKRRPEDSVEANDSSLTDNEGLKRKMEESFDNIIKRLPKLQETEKPGNGAVVHFNHFDDSNKEDDKPKTYGMHLERDHGYMWNDLTNSGKPIYVGNLENIKATEPSIHHKSTTTKIEENKIETHTELPKPTTNSNDEKVTQVPILITTEKQVTVAVGNRGTTENPKDEREEKLVDKKDCNCTKDTINENKDVDKSNNNETDTLKVTLDALLKKDEFWQWLSNWTSTYMEVVNERVETLVKNEVANKLKQMNDDKNNNKTNDANDKVDKGNKTIDDKVDKESDGTKANTTECTKIDDSKTNNNTSDNKQLNTTAITLEPEESKNEINSTTEKNNTELISGGNESNKTNITDQDQDISKGRNKTSPLNIKSGKIYGNAIGNDHVTNIFIFYPSVDSNKTIEKLDSAINKTNSENSAKDKDNNVDDVISKAKDLLSGEKNTSSTIPSQQNKDDVTEKSKNASNENMTEKSPTTSATKEELKNNKINNTDSKVPNDQGSKSTTELHESTSDKTNSDTKETDKANTTTGAPTKADDVTTQASKDVSQSDKDVTNPISTINNSSDAKTDKPDTTIEKSESVTAKSNSPTEKSESTTAKSDLSTEKSETTTAKLDSSTEKSDLSTEKSDLSTEKSDSTTEKSDSTTKTSDSTTEKSDSKATSDATSTEKSANS